MDRLANGAVRRRTITMAAVLGCAIACAPRGDNPTGPSQGEAPGSTVQSEPPELDEATLAGLSAAELAARAHTLARLAAQHEASARGVRLARQGAQAARLAFERDRSREMGQRAHQLLRMAARRKRLPGACQASIELAELERTALGDPEAAYLSTYRTLARFQDEPGHGECLGRARATLSGLVAHRPAVERLAEVDADPDLDDPSVAVPPRSGAPPVPAIAAAPVEGAAPSQARLQQVALYGAHRSTPKRVVSKESGVRVVLRFEGTSVYRRGELAAEEGLPRRVFLDLDEVVVDEGIPSLLPVDAGGLIRLRTFPLGEGRTRVSFDVKAETEYRAFYLTDPYRVIMDFRLPREQRAGSGPLIVLDPGHGGRNPGAKGPNGLRESDVALSLARRVRRSLKRSLPGARVLLTRDDNYAVSLEERAAIANAHGADVFVSIHLNASHSPNDRGGVSTFVLDTTNDAAALRLAARENGTVTQNVTELQKILASIYREDQVLHSSKLARLVQAETLRNGRRVLPQLPDRGVKKALFYVLVGATMPAVLVEASFITRPEEAVALATDEYRQALADGIATGVRQYLDRHAGRGAP